MSKKQHQQSQQSQQHQQSQQEATTSSSSTTSASSSASSSSSSGTTVAVRAAVPLKAAEVEMLRNSDISQYYAGKSVFITGATGFVGKALVEKLLRACPNLGTIYMLVREKKGKSARERVNELVNCKLFEKLEATQPNYRSKLVAVNGDLTEIELGINEEDQKMLHDNVHIVFHSAATVRFDEPLKVAVDMNIIGTKRVIDLSKKMKNLEAFIHVSTAYANCDRQFIAEEVYPSPVEPGKLIDAVNWMDSEMTDLLTPKVLKTRPNTYTYTKAVAETLVIDECKDLPCAIIRPSIVGASWREPFPGWVDNFNGPAALFPATGSGLLRTMLAHPKAVADLIPLDIPVNLMIAAAWYTANKQKDQKQIVVYNCTSGQINTLTWGMFEFYGLRVMEKFPLDRIFIVPNPHFTQYKFVKNFRTFFEQLVPAYAMDVVLRVIQKKPLFVKLQKRVKKAVGILEYFTTKQWVFTNNNIFMLQKEMNDADKKLFNFDVKDLNWATYFETYGIGAKVHLMKEDITNIDKARANYARMIRTQKMVFGAVIILALRLVMNRSKTVRAFFEFIFGFVLKFAQRVFKALPIKN